VDELLLQDAFNLHKPILGICYGVQALNVWLNGSLIQDLGTVLNTPVDHAPGRDVVNAHPIHLDGASRLSKAAGGLENNCNSSHHQAIGRPGDNLRVTGVCPTDGVIEAVELDSPSHFVVGVQWHPERTYTASPLSRALFAAFAKAAETWQPRSVERSAAPA
jgi:putative glutamine amidotransferase